MLLAFRCIAPFYLASTRQELDISDYCCCAVNHMLNLCAQLVCPVLTPQAALISSTYIEADAQDAMTACTEMLKLWRSATHAQHHVIPGVHMCVQCTSRWLSPHATQLQWCRLLSSCTQVRKSVKQGRGRPSLSFLRAASQEAAPWTPAAEPADKVMHIDKPF